MCSHWNSTRKHYNVHPGVDVLWLLWHNFVDRSINRFAKHFSCEQEIASIHVSTQLHSKCAALGYVVCDGWVIIVTVRRGVRMSTGYTIDSMISTKCACRKKSLHWVYGWFLELRECFRLSIEYLQQAAQCTVIACLVWDFSYTME